MYICNILKQIWFLPREATWGVQVLKVKKKNRNKQKNTACPNKECPQLLCMILCRRTSREMVGF